MPKPYFAPSRKKATGSPASTRKGSKRLAFTSDTTPLSRKCDDEVVRLVLKSGSSVTLLTDTVETVTDKLGEEDCTMVCGLGRDGALRAVPFNNIDFIEGC